MYLTQGYINTQCQLQLKLNSSLNGIVFFSFFLSPNGIANFKKFAISVVAFGKVAKGKADESCLYCQ